MAAIGKDPPAKQLTDKEIELIENLVRLANNNNADAEANVAARRVCKLLENYKFKIQPVTQKQPDVSPSNPYAYGNWNPWYGKAQEDFFRDVFSKGFKRSTTKSGNPPPGSNREAKQGPTETKSKPHADYGYNRYSNRDPFKDYEDAYYNTKKEEQYTEVHIEDFDDISDRLSDIYDEIAKTGKFPKGVKAKELEIFLKHQNWERNGAKVTIYCGKCKRMVSTGYTGPTTEFVCLKCELEKLK